MMEDAQMVLSGALSLPVRTAGDVPWTLKERPATVTWAPGGPWQPASKQQSGKWEWEEICAICSFCTQWLDCWRFIDSIMTQSHHEIKQLFFFIVHVGRGLTALNDWRIPAHVTREKTDTSLEDLIHILIKKFPVKTLKKKKNAHGWTVHNKIYKIHLEIRYCELSFHANLKE